MSITEVKKFLTTVFSHVTFEYNGLNCGIDPYNKAKFVMWYGDKTTTVNSIEAVMTTKFFDGKSLEEIWNDIVELDY